MKKIILSAAVLLSMGAFAQTNIQSGIHLKKGQVITTGTTADTDVEFSMGSMKNNMASKAKLTVIGEDPSNYILTLQMTGIKMSMDAMGQSMTIDSDKPEDMKSEAGQSFADKLNKLDTFQLSKNDGKGKLISQPTTEEQSNPMMMGMDNQQNAGFNGTFLALPSTKPGYSWTDSVKVKNLKTKTTYTLQSIENNIATVKQSMSVDGTSEIETQGMTMNMTIGMKTDGVLKVDLQTGIVISNNSNTDMNSSMDAMGQQIPITGKVVTTATAQ